MSRHAILPLSSLAGPLGVVCAWAALLVASEPNNSGEPPYQAFVSKRVVMARSGPGMAHYPTDALTIGERVEVLEVEDGWLAIRAPRDSFAWVAGEHLRFAPDQKFAEITRNDVACWVGSNIEAVDQHTSQVKLRRGERVVVIERRQLDSTEKPTKTWVKIEPPTGERRWVPSADVSREVPAGVVVSAVQDSKGAAADGMAREKSEADAGESAENGWIDRSRGNSRRGRFDLDPSESASSSVARSRSDDGRGSVTRREGLTTEPAVGSWTMLLNFPPGASFDDRLARLQLALSRAVANGGTVAQMDLLEQQSARLIQEGKTAYERGQATVLLESIREFRKLARRRRVTIQRASYTGPRDDGPIGTGLKQMETADHSRGLLESLSLEVQAAVDATGLMGVSQGASSPTRGNVAPYLAEGWLMPVSSPSRAAPPFVLMDAEGHPVAFVTPAPGVNLRRYVDKQVGIMGQRAFGVLDRQHVIAHRAIDLSRHRDPPAVERAASPWIRTRESDTGTRLR